MKTILDTKHWNELENAAWAIPDETPEGERLRAALIEAMRERELILSTLNEPVGAA